MFQDLFEGFIHDLELIGRDKRTIAHHKDNIRLVVGPLLGNKPIKSILPIDASVLIQEGNRRGVTNAFKYVCTFRRIIAYARKLGHTFSFDLDDIELPVVKRLRGIEALTKEEIAAIRRAFSIERDRMPKRWLSPEWKAKHIFAVTRTQALFELLLHTGLRISEALALDREQIDEKVNEIVFRNVKSKEWNKVFTFGALKHLGPYLKMRKDSDPALFISWNGNRLPFYSAERAFIKLRERMGIRKHITHRTLRSTFVTLLMENGLDIKETQKLARHRSVVTTLRYYYKVDFEKLKPRHESVMSLI